MCKDSNNNQITKIKLPKKNNLFFSDVKNTCKMFAFLTFSFYLCDSLGHVVAKPQFKCALPFKDGKAKVTYTGHESDPHDEHSEWVSDDWFYIDYQGKKLPVEP